MKNKKFIKTKIEDFDVHPGKDVEKLQSLFSLNNYHYKNINQKEEEIDIACRWPLLKLFNHVTQRG